MTATEPEDIRNRLLVARLPAMPQILLELLQLCQADEAGMAELAKLIGRDAGITHRVMQVANSAAYHRSGRKATLLAALNVLGADLVKTLVIAESVFQTFNGFGHAASVDLRGFWRHSLTAAVVARDVARAMGYAQTEEAYLAGLLHDVGRLALLAVAPEVYHFNFHSPDSENLCTVEQRTLLISHAEAGAWLIERWQLDSFLADAVLYHHEDTARLGAAHALIRLVHLAHLLSDQVAQTPLAAGLGAICNLSDAQLQDIYQGAQAQVTTAAEQLGIDLNGLSPAAPPQEGAPRAAPVNPVQQRLSDEIRNRTLIAELAQVFARQKDDTQLLQSVRQNARILFDLDDTAVFLMNSGARALVGVAVGEMRQRLADFAITLSAGGAMAEAALQRKMVVLQRQRGLLSVAEDQLLRVFGSDALLCLPLASPTRCFGMLVAGVTPVRLAEFKRQEKFLLAFGAQAALALDQAARERGEIDRRIAALREEHLQNSRKVAHEANNPLSIIKNYLGVLDDKLARQEPVAGELSILNEEIDRVGSIIKEFAGVAPAAPAAAVELNRVVADIVRLFRESRFLPASVQIAARLPETPCSITGQTDTLKQILVNLIKNAVEAMPKGGRIEVVNHGKTRRDGGDFFALEVKDSGPGLPDEVLAKLFSPVRSSKAGDNRGLGLSIVHGLVKKLGGQISCNSSPLGTSFDILLPASAAAIPAR